MTHKVQNTLISMEMNGNEWVFRYICEPSFLYITSLSGGPCHLRLSSVTMNILVLVSSLLALGHVSPNDDTLVADNYDYYYDYDYDNDYDYDYDNAYNNDDIARGLPSLDSTFARKQKKCPSETVNKEKNFYKWTETFKKNGNTKPVADQPCWFDLTRYVSLDNRGMYIWSYGQAQLRVLSQLLF